MFPLAESLVGFCANLVIVIIIVRFIYYPARSNRNYIFAFFALNTTVFFVMRLLNSFDISLGVGFGLFAIFSILRYRTSTIPIHAMTYLFVLIALAMVNSILLNNRSYDEFIFTNTAMISVLYVLEQGWGFRYETRKSITYDRIDLIRPENWSHLMEDLQKRTGLHISHIEIGHLDFVRDTAEIRIYYNASQVNTAQVSLVETDHLLSEET